MTPTQYATARERIGNQSEVARMLGVARSTVAHRESGKMKITKEAALAIAKLKGGAKAKRKVNG